MSDPAAGRGLASRKLWVTFAAQALVFLSGLVLDPETARYVIAALVAVSVPYPLVEGIADIRARGRGKHPYVATPSRLAGFLVLLAGTALAIAGVVQTVV